VAIVMVAAAIISIAAIGIFNLISARDALNGASERELSDIAASNVRALLDRAEATRRAAVVLANDPAVEFALDDMASAFRALPEATVAEQQAALEAAYGSELEGAPSSSEDPPPEALVPTSGRAQHLQYWYIAQNPNEERALLDKASDGSSYSDRHAVHHPMLRAMATAAGPGDLLLVDPDGIVVYSVDKNIEVGTDLISGPHQDGVLAEAILSARDDVGAGEAGGTDLRFYAPARYAPTSFIVSPVGGEAGLSGYVAVEFSGSDLTYFTTNGLDWKGAGLGDTGEIYLVGGDRTMRSDSRLWLEDPDEYLADAREQDPATADEIATRRTTMLTQPVDTEAVDEALVRGSFAGLSSDYLGRETYTVAESIPIQDTLWVIVSSVTTEEAYSSLRNYLWDLLILVLILIPIVVLGAWVTSRRILRPVDVLVSAAQEVGEGSADVVAPDFGKDEFGDVSVRLNDVIDAMQRQEEELHAADEQTTELLLASMPAPLADRMLKGDRSVEHEVRTATVMVGVIDDPQAVDPVEQDALAGRTVEVAAQFKALAERYGAEKLQSSSKEYVFAVGLASASAEANDAVAFALGARAVVADVAENSGVALTCRIGLAAGDVVEGLVGEQRISFTVWGAPVTLAGDLAGAALPGDVLVDATVAGRLEDRWSLESLDDVANAAGVRLDAWRVTNAIPVAQTAGPGEDGL
jgi:class 3 adenylate cyclase